MLSKDVEVCAFMAPNLSRARDGEALSCAIPAVNVLLVFSVDDFVCCKLGEHKGVSLGDDPEDRFSFVLFTCSIPRVVVGDPRERLLGECGAGRFFPFGVVVRDTEGSFFGLNVSPVLLSFASSSSRSSLLANGLSTDQFNLATLCDLDKKRKLVNIKSNSICVL